MRPATSSSFCLSLSLSLPLAPSSSFVSPPSLALFFPGPMVRFMVRGKHGSNQRAWTRSGQCEDPMRSTPPPLLASLKYIEFCNFFFYLSSVCARARVRVCVCVCSFLEAQTMCILARIEGSSPKTTTNSKLEELIMSRNGPPIRRFPPLKKLPG